MRCRAIPLNEGQPALKTRAIAALLLATALSAASQSDSAVPSTFKVAIGHFSHEATTFSPEIVELADFAQPDLTGDSLLAHNEAIQGFVKAVHEMSNATIVPLTSHGPIIGGSSKGWISNDAFEHYVRLMLDDLRAALPVDAVFLSLHGAAAVQGVDRPEAELVKRIRKIVGPIVPIAATFDPHGNEDQVFLKYANFSFAMKYYPHYDGRHQGERAARLLVQTARGHYSPTTATCKPGIVTPTVFQWTGQEPWKSIVQRALIWEAREPDVYVSYFFGYPWSDVPDIGATFQVMTNDNPDLARYIAADMSSFMWRNRKELFQTELYSPVDAVALASKAQSSGKSPIVLADYSDRTGDATHILQAVVDQGLQDVIIATLRDETVIADLDKSVAMAGQKVQLSVGGKNNPAASGKPVPITGELVFYDLPPRIWGEVGDSDEKVAVIRFGANNVLIITNSLVQVTSPEQLDSLPIETNESSVFVVKSRVHFRRGFDDTGYAKTIILVDAPGPYLGTVHLNNLEYENVDISVLYPFAESSLPIPECD